MHGPQRAWCDWSGVIHELGPRFAARAAQHDATDTFVAENFAELKAHGVLAAAVPHELGGGGAPYADLCAMVRIAASYCGSTALALSMHTHTVATAAWRWRRDPQPVERLLRRVADERLLLVGSGASDWLTPSAAADRVDGGFRVTGEKMFASGAPAGDLFITQALYQDPDAGPTALHFGLRFDDPCVHIRDTWRALGMRGTGSHHVHLDGVFVPDAAITLRRPAGQWTPVFHLYACIIPLPLIYATYLGIAEAARDAALAFARKRGADAGLEFLIGDLETELAAARIAHQDMVAAAASCSDPGPDITNRVIIGRTLVGGAAARVVDKAMEAVGGSAFYRAAGVERLFRDVQGARFHRPQPRAQSRFSGRLALGLDPEA